MDAGFLQANLLNPVCQVLGMTSCPQLPTVSQILIETSALENVAPNFIRGQIIPVLGTTSDTCTVAGNFGFDVCDNVAINAVNPLASSVNPSDLRNLTPLAFIGPTAGSAQAVPYPLGTLGLNSFFYAVASEANGQPTALSLFYDYRPLTPMTFTKGQQVAAISLPLVIRKSDGSEQPVTTTLQISATCTGGTSCLTATAIGNFQGNGTQKRSPGDLGITVTLDFSTGHALFQVQAPLIVTGTNDPAYFGVVPPGATNPLTPVGSQTSVNQASGLPTAFSTDVPGFPTAFLRGATDGIAPDAAPLCTAATCPNPPPTTPPTTAFGFCASFLATGGTTSLNPAVAAFLGIGTDGTTYVSSPKSATGIQCPF
jgi:hypothetical protein